MALVAVALLRGSIVGAIAGFCAGLLLDTATLETLGLTSLLLTLAGYWVGRYGETTGRDRTHAPFLSVAVVTFLSALGGLALHFVLGERAPARRVLFTRCASGIAAQPDPDPARLRARAPALRRRAELATAARGAAAWLDGDRAGSRRFLPPDPRV